MKNKNKAKVKIDHATIAYTIEQQNLNHFYSKSQLELYLNDIGFNIYVMDYLNYPTLYKLIQEKVNLAKDQYSCISRPMWLSNHHTSFFCTYGRMFTIFDITINIIGKTYTIRLDIQDIDDGDNRFYKNFESKEEYKAVFNLISELLKEEILDIDLLKGIILEYNFKRN